MFGQLAIWGNAESSPSGVRDRARTQTHFNSFTVLKTHFVTKILNMFVRAFETISFLFLNTVV